MPIHAKSIPALATMLWLATLAGCETVADNEPPTMIVLVPVFDSALQLTQVELLSGEHHARWPEPARELQSGENIHIVLSDPVEAGRPMPIVAWGLRDEARIARGQVDVTPVQHSTVQATVELAQLPCGDWCTPGARECQGDAVRECVSREADGCTQWGPATGCPSDAPYCSLGTCSAECVEECSEGSTRCLGTGSVQACGQADSDPCLDWSTVDPCPEGQSCDRGACDASTCHDDCSDGERSCQGNAVTVCGHYDADDCLDWGPPTACPDGQSCNAGACAPIGQCADECTVGVCWGDSYRSCGQFDLDACQDLGPVMSCVSNDPCFEPGCDSHDGCLSTAKLCGNPPEAHCVDGDTLEVFDPAGTCVEGDCTYESRQVDCPSCPNCDPCADVTCNEKKPCFESVGTCSNGYCEYGFADGEDCDDGDACTVEDECASGVCVGETVVCDQPGPSECISDVLLHTYESLGACDTGQCSYEATDQVCPNGCVAGACGCVARSDVIASNAAEHASIVANLAHGVHVSFLTAPSGSLAVAHRQADATWTTETVAAHAQLGTSLAMGPNGELHVAYVNASNRIACSSRSSGGTWQTEIVDANTGQTWPSLAVDSTGTLHVAYANSGGWVNYATRQPGGTWNVDSYVTSDGEEMTDVSLAVDAQGGVHISLITYQDPALDFEHHSLQYLYKASGCDWQVTKVLPSYDAVPGHYTSLVPNPGGGAFIVYRDAAFGLSMAKIMPGGDPTISFPGPSGTPVNGRFVRLARDGSGLLHLLYASGGKAWQMRSTDANGIGWAPPGLVATVGEATGCSLALDADGAVHLGFQDATPKTLHYVRVCP